jgi:hypothetical protein
VSPPSSGSPRDPGERDKVIALERGAATGKTPTLAAVRDAAERESYQVEGSAPTSRAARKPAEAGIESSTLQHHLARGDQELPATDHGASGVKGALRRLRRP